MNELERRLVAEVQRAIEVEAAKPFTVAVMGQTGVGKSSLINALFGTNLATDPIRPCTKEIEKVVEREGVGRELWFYDLPGIGESDDADEQYLSSYAEVLLEADVVLWAMHADNRSISFDVGALSQILSRVDVPARAALLSKVTFVLTKADLIAPQPWILAKDGNDCSFAPGRRTLEILESKAHYIQDAFISPHGSLYTSSTFNDGTFTLPAGNFPITFDSNSVTYHGLINEQTLSHLINAAPLQARVLQRLYENYQVIPCSSVFRYNLAKLMLVIVNKLGPSAIGRFAKFTSTQSMANVPVRTAATFSNIVVVDRNTGKLMFDLVSSL